MSHFSLNQPLGRLSLYVTMPFSFLLVLLTALWSPVCGFFVPILMHFIDEINLQTLLYDCPLTVCTPDSTLTVCTLDCTLIVCTPDCTLTVCTPDCTLTVCTLDCTQYSVSAVVCRQYSVSAVV